MTIKLLATTSMKAALSPAAAQKISALLPDAFGHPPGGFGDANDGPGHPPGGFGVTTIYGSNYDDVFSGNSAREIFHGGAGNDTFNWSGGADTYFGDGGFDTVSYRGATSAVDVSLVRDKVGAAGAGSLGGAAGDTFDGIENIVGSKYGDTIRGDGGSNRIDGFDGNDRLFGGGGNDVIGGGNGDDTIVGGVGADILSGGYGQDTFVFNSVRDGGDHITDFAHEAVWWNFNGQSGYADLSDRIEISREGFGLSNSFTINANTFRSGDHAVAVGNGPQFIYDTSAHTLSFDANGAQAGGVTVLATFDNGQGVLASDMFLV